MNYTQNQLVREKEFHDQWASSINIDTIDINVPYEGSTAPENRFILSLLGDIKGKYLLDIGCGAGESAVYFAKKGAKCMAIDWSPAMVATAKKLAKRNRVKIDAKTVNAMDMCFDENTFDIVYASNILHHVDSDVALKEMHRVLKPGGMAAMWEPLKHNPIINVYRRIAKEVRTADERPLDIKFVNNVENLFSKVQYDTFWFLTLWILIRFFLVERVNPNKERYWKKIYYDEPRIRDSYLRLEKIDHFIKRFKPIKALAWTLAIVAQK